MLLSSWKQLFAARLRASRINRRRRRVPQASSRIEQLEDRTLLSSASFADGVFAFTSDAGLVNNVTVSESGGLVTIRDTAASITPTGLVQQGADSNEVTFATSQVTRVQLDLGDGADTATAAGLAIPLLVDAGDGADSITGGEAGDTLNGSNDGDSLVGGGGNDKLNGSGGDDVLIGGAGDDTANGGGGEDTLDGGTGNDLVRGQGSEDTLTGGADDDTIDGGPAYDQVRETADADFTITDTSLTGDGNDVLVDIEETYLTGGSSPNTFDGTGFDGRFVVNAKGGNDTLLGGAHADRLLGGAGRDSIIGGDGDDVLRGQGGGFDTLVGGPGNDRLNGGIGGDLVQGGEGNDQLTGETGNDTLEGGTGTDKLVERDNADMTLSDTSLTGDLGTDVILSIERAFLKGGNSDNTLDASSFSGRVTMVGVGGDDVLVGGPGADSLIGRAGDDTLNGGPGADTLKGLSGSDSLNGGADNDTLDGGSDNDTVVGEAGDDRLVGSLGDDNLDGGDGADTLLGKEGNDTLDGGNGDDNLDGALGDDSLTGGAGDDTLADGMGDDTVEGGGGDDEYQLTPGSTDLVTDTGGDDRLNFSGASAGITLDIDATTLQAATVTGNLQLTGVFEDVTGSGFDDSFSADSLGSSRTIDGGGGTDTLTADDVANAWSITGSDAGTVAGDVAFSGFESLQGGSDTDTFAFADGVSFSGTVDGGSGSDALDYSAWTTAVTVDLDQGTATGTGGATNFVNATGGSGGDQLTGDDQDNVLDGGDGSDTLLGKDGNDLLSDGMGNDSLAGGDGDDQYVLTPGSDDVVEDNGENETVDFSGAENGVIFDLVSSGIQQVFGGHTVQFLGTVAAIVGSEFNDVLTAAGAEHSVTMHGLGGDDLLRGSDSHDTIDGGPGDDEITGGEGADDLSGGDGSDVVKVQGDVDTYVSATEIIGIWKNTIDGFEDVEVTGGPSNNTIDASEFPGNVLLLGGPGHDVLIGGSGRSELFGGDGDDELRGGDSADELYGGPGDDLLIGGGADDKLYGQDDDDDLRGGAGASDELTGGPGQDTYSDSDAVIDDDDSVVKENPEYARDVDFADSLLLDGVYPNSGPVGTTVSIVVDDPLADDLHDNLVTFSGFGAELSLVRPTADASLKELVVTVPEGAVSGEVRLRTAGGVNRVVDYFSVTEVRPVTMQVPAGIDPAEYIITSTASVAEDSDNDGVSDSLEVANGAVQMLMASRDNDQQPDLMALYTGNGDLPTFNAESTAKAYLHLVPFFTTNTPSYAAQVDALFDDTPEVAALVQTVEAAVTSHSDPLEDEAVLTALEAAVEAVAPQLHTVTPEENRTRGAAAEDPINLYATGEDLSSLWLTEADGPKDLKLTSPIGNALAWVVEVVELDLEHSFPLGTRISTDADDDDSVRTASVHARYARESDDEQPDAVTDALQLFVPPASIEDNLTTLTGGVDRQFAILPGNPAMGRFTVFDSSHIKAMGQTLWGLIDSTVDYNAYDNSIELDLGDAGVYAVRAFSGALKSGSDAPALPDELDSELDLVRQHVDFAVPWALAATYNVLDIVGDSMGITKSLVEAFRDGGAKSHSLPSVKGCIDSVLIPSLITSFQNHGILNETNKPPAAVIEGIFKTGQDVLKKILTSGDCQSALLMKAMRSRSGFSNILRRSLKISSKARKVAAKALWIVEGIGTIGKTLERASAMVGASTLNFSMGRKISPMESTFVVVGDPFSPVIKEDEPRGYPVEVDDVDPFKITGARFFSPVQLNGQGEHNLRAFLHLKDGDTTGERIEIEIPTGSGVNNFAAADTTLNELWLKVPASTCPGDYILQIKSRGDVWTEQSIKVTSPAVINTLSDDVGFQPGDQTGKFPNYSQTRILVTGSGFCQRATRVFFKNGETETQANVNWAESRGDELVVYVPDLPEDPNPGEELAVKLVIRNDESPDSSQAEADFKILGAPLITALSPNEPQQGALVTIDGTAFSADRSLLQLEIDIDLSPDVQEFVAQTEWSQLSISEGSPDKIYFVLPALNDYSGEGHDNRTAIRISSPAGTSQVFEFNIGDELTVIERRITVLSHLDDNSVPDDEITLREAIEIASGDRRIGGGKRQVLGSHYHPHYDDGVLHEDLDDFYWEICGEMRYVFVTDPGDPNGNDVYSDHSRLTLFDPRDINQPEGPCEGAGGGAGVLSWEGGPSYKDDISYRAEDDPETQRQRPVVPVTPLPAFKPTGDSLSGLIEANPLAPNGAGLTVTKTDAGLSATGFVGVDITGFSGAGVQITEHVTQLVVFGSFVGNHSGILVESGNQRVSISGLIYGNWDGVYVEPGNQHLDIVGSEILLNIDDGIDLRGGSTFAYDNLIFDNSGDGINVSGTSTGSNTFVENIIGLPDRLHQANPVTTLVAGNKGAGIAIRNGSSRNIIARNTIVGSSGSGVLLTGEGTDHNVVEANWIGVVLAASGVDENLNFTGPAVHAQLNGTTTGNGVHGVEIAAGASDNLVGRGTPPDNFDWFNTMQVIGANQKHGVFVHGEGTDNNVIRNNLLGVPAVESLTDGLEHIGNVESGVAVACDTGEQVGPRNLRIGNNFIGSNSSASAADSAGILVAATDIAGAVCSTTTRITANEIGADIAFLNSDASKNNGARGILLRDVSDVIITMDNWVHNETVGVELLRSRSNRLSSLFVNESASTGLYILDSTDNEVEFTYVSDGNADGVVIEGGSQNFISNSELFSNQDWGLVLKRTSSDPPPVPRPASQTSSGGADAPGLLPPDLGTHGVAFTHVRQNGSGGVLVTEGASNNVLQGLIVTANTGPGVHITGSQTTGNTLVASLIGLKPDGNQYAVSANTGHGVLVDGEATYTRIGNDLDAGRVWGNAISGNGDDGVRIEGDVEIVAVTGNFIGTNPTGIAAMANAGDGISIGGNARNVAIGGDDREEGNLVSGNGDVGVRIDGENLWDVKLLNNVIGMNAGATVALANVSGGVIASDLDDSSGRVLEIGRVGEGNRIGGNAKSGIIIDDSSGIIVSGNQIGVGVNDTPIGNQEHGVLVKGSSENIWIGSGNRIMNNLEDGVHLAGHAVGGTHDISIVKNEISGNTNNGINIVLADQNEVLSNTVVGNGVCGVQVNGAAAAENLILPTGLPAASAFITNNGSRGICLVNAANDAIQPPVITHVSPLQISGTVDEGIVNGSVVDVFADISDEGRTYLGSAMVIKSEFFLPNPILPLGTHVTATVTDRDSNTSEFGIEVQMSACGVINWPPQPSIEAALPGTISYVSSRDGNNEIYLITGDGQQRLTNDPASDVDPVVSADGKRVAFASDRDSANWDVYVVDIDSPENPIRVTSDAGQDRQPSWSPDGTKLAFVSDRTGSEQVFIIEVDDLDQIDQVTSASDSLHGIDDPNWSPDGQQLAFVARQDDSQADRDLYTIGIAGSGLNRLTTSDADDADPDWSHDGSVLLFTSDRGGQPALHLLTSLSGDPQVAAVLRNGVAVEGRQPAWSPCSDVVVFSAETGAGTELFVLHLADKGLQQLTVSSGDNLDSDWI